MSDSLVSLIAACTFYELGWTGPSWILGVIFVLCAIGELKKS
jgi:hypothetical protein